MPCQLRSWWERSNQVSSRGSCGVSTEPNREDLTNLQPRLSWVLETVGSQPAIRGLQQKAYQVLVSASEATLQANHGDLWDSGKVPSDALFNVVYAGQPLPSWQRCFWKVRVWDQNGCASNWSEPALWTMGLVKAEDWKDAQWIGISEPERPAPDALESPESRRLAARHLRREFDVGGPLRSATVALCGLGLSELYLNGEKVGDEVLSPPLS